MARLIYTATSKNIPLTAFQSLRCYAFYYLFITAEEEAIFQKAWSLLSIIRRVVRQEMKYSIEAYYFSFIC